VRWGYRVTHILPEKTTSKCSKVVINISQGSAATSSRWSRQINNFCVAYYLNILCAKYCRNWSTYVHSTIKWTVGYFLTHPVHITQCSKTALHSTQMVLTIQLWHGWLQQVVCLANLTAAASDVVSRQSLDEDNEPPVHDPSMQCQHNSYHNFIIFTLCFNICVNTKHFSPSYHDCLVR